MSKTRRRARDGKYLPTDPLGYTQADERAFEALAAEVRDQGPRCESGWTGDRCTFPLHHDGPHSNESESEARFAWGDR